MADQLPDKTSEVVITHEFEGDICIHCGAYYEDALYGGIGCEAGPEGNNPAYLGSALTPEEQGGERGFFSESAPDDAASAPSVPARRAD